MAETRKLVKLGLSSIVISIPSSIVKKMALKDGEELEVDYDWKNDQIIIRKPQAHAETSPES